MPILPLLHQPGGALDDLDEREENHLSDGDMALGGGKCKGWHSAGIFSFSNISIYAVACSLYTMRRRKNCLCY